MSEILDVVTRLSYEVVGSESLKNTIDKLQNQATVIESLKSKLVDLNKQYATETNVKAQQNLSGQITKTTEQIDKQTIALTKNFNNNKKLQAALKDEVGTIQQLTEYIKQASKERATQVDPAKIREYTSEIKKAQFELKELITIGKTPTNKVEQGTSVIGSLFSGGGAGGSLGRQVLNGAAIGLGIGGGFGLIARSVSAATEALGEYIHNITHANEVQNKLKDDIEAFNGSFTKEIENLVNFNKILSAAFGSGETGYAANLEAVKALGVEQGKVFNAEEAQFKAQQELRQAQKSDLQDLQNKYRDVFNLFLRYDKGGDLNGLRKGLEGLGLSKEDLRQFKENIDNYLIARQKLKPLQRKDFRLSEQNDVPFELAKLQAAQNKLQEESDNARTKRETDLQAQRYQKNLTLLQDIATAEESYRELKEKQEINSVDKIARDTEAKLKLSQQRIIKERDLAEKQLGIRVFNQIDPDTGTSIADDYAKKLKLDKLSANQAAKNYTEEFLKQSSLLALQNAANESATAANIDRTAVALGLPSYDALTQLLDKETSAKKLALEVDFAQQKRAYIANGDDITGIQNQYTEKGIQIDQQAYTDRLQLATEYYQKLAVVIRQQASVLATEAETAIINRGGSNTQISRRTRRDANNRAIDTNNALLPKAFNAYNTATAAVQTAATPEQRKAAVAAALTAEQEVARLENDNAKRGRDNANLDIEIQLERIQVFQEFVNATVQGYNTIADARQRDLDREISAREQRVAAATELAKRGNTEALAIEQKSLDKANQERRKQALITQEINSALVISNSLLAVTQAAVAGGGALTAPLIIATIAALGVGFSQAYALAQSSKTGFKEGGYTGDIGENSEAGIVHGREFVMTAEKTRKYRPLLEAMHEGRPLPLQTIMPQGMHQYEYGAFASKSEVGVLAGKLDDIHEAINNKSVRVSQSMDKRGLSQMVVEEQRSNRILWAKH